MRGVRAIDGQVRVYLRDIRASATNLEVHESVQWRSSTQNGICICFPNGVQCINVEPASIGHTQSVHSHVPFLTPTGKVQKL